MTLEKPATGQATTPAVKAVLYVRCSTTQQETDNQRIALEQWAQRRGFEVVATYAENESAWRNGHQRELARLLSDAPKGKFDTVLVWALDRLSRQGALTILSLVNRLQRSGVRVFSYQESWTEVPGELADLLYSIVAWVAAFESKRLSERTKAGLARSKAQAGKLPVRGKDKRRRKKRSVKVSLGT